MSTILNEARLPTLEEKLVAKEEARIKAEKAEKSKGRTITSPKSKMKNDKKETKKSSK